MLRCDPVNNSYSANHRHHHHLLHLLHSRFVSVSSSKLIFVVVVYWLLFHYYHFSNTLSHTHTHKIQVWGLHVAGSKDWVENSLLQKRTRNVLRALCMLAMLYAILLYFPLYVNIAHCALDTSYVQGIHLTVPTMLWILLLLYKTISSDCRWYITFSLHSPPLCTLHMLTHSQTDCDLCSFMFPSGVMTVAWAVWNWYLYTHMHTLTPLLQSRQRF